jgi:hypothetical protein
MPNCIMKYLYFECVRILIYSCNEDKGLQAAKAYTEWPGMSGRILNIFNEKRWSTATLRFTR